MHRLAQQSGLVDALNQNLTLFKLHLPYTEADHVLNLAFNTLAGGTCLQDIELRRNDLAYLDALGAERIPDPTTAGDFCRRFSERDVERLHDAINQARRNVWKRQPASFFQQATIEMDGTFVTTSGQTKQGVSLSYKKEWSYHPLVVTLAETGEVLSLVNRSGNRPSHEGAAAQADRAIALCREAGFAQIRLRGDTDFSQTQHLDRWDQDRVQFVFGYDSTKNLQEQAEMLPTSAWRLLARPARYQVQTQPRRKPENVKARIVEERGYENLRLDGEQVAEFPYRPVACRQPYRLVVVRKDLLRENVLDELGQRRLFYECRYFFYITNDRQSSAEEIVRSANARCDQENLIAQLSGMRALSAPVDNLLSNGAYMLMSSLAWTLKAWSALWLPVHARWRDRHEADRDQLLGMEFRTFVNHFMRLPCQLVHQARRRVLRVLNWSEHQGLFFRLCDALRC